MRKRQPWGSDRAAWKRRIYAEESPWFQRKGPNRGNRSAIAGTARQRNSKALKAARERPRRWKSSGLGLSCYLREPPAKSRGQP
jgi:hypothetical protein